MRFTAALFVGLASAQVALINGVMSNINSQVLELDTAINGLKAGDTGDTVIAASDKILKTTADGLTAVAGAQPVVLLDAVQIQGTVQTLTDSLKKTIDDLIAKKPLILQAGQGAKTESSLQAQLDGATKLAKAISGKVPPEVSELAITLSGDILKQIQRGLAAFAGSPGPAAGAGAGAGSSAPAAGMGASIGSSSSTVGSTTVAGAAGAAAGAGAGSAAGSAAGSSAGGASPAMSAGGMSGGAMSAGGASSPAMYTGAAASMKPASVFGLVAVAAAIFAM